MKNSLKKILLLTLLFSTGSVVHSQESLPLIQDVVNEKASVYSLTEEDTQSWEITNSHEDQKSGISFYYLTQKHGDLFLHNAISVVAIKNQKAFLTSNGFVPNLAQKVETRTATISAKDAILSGVKSLGLEFSGEIKQREKKNINHYLFDAEGVSKEEINVRLKLFQINEEIVRAVWDLDIYQLDRKHWWHIRIDAQTGELLDKADWVSQCDVGPGSTSHAGHNHTEGEFTPSGTSRQGAGYNVFAIPVESPNHGPRSLVVNPADPIASPYGWHDVDGIAGPEFITTRGNNVHAYEDHGDNDYPGYAPDGGSTLNFNFPLDFNQHPHINVDAAITNLFYMNNIMHDVWYQYGFDEASGNFQQNNYGKGGLDDDYVVAEAQDGGGMNNANFGTPPDGYNPYMQMYLWSLPSQDLVTVNSPNSISGIYAGLTAAFGPPVTSTPITANLVLYEDNSSNPLEACQPAINTIALNGKIAVVRRGTCGFVDKVQNAENAGAIAVIVINNTAGGPSVMGGTDPGIGIPSVMISMADGAILVAELELGIPVNVTIQENYTTNPLDSDFDNGIVAHEYGHGISNRLTGGADEVSCLQNDEQMGEGWSDWFGLMVTIQPGDQGTDARGKATYSNGEPASGGGIRPLPYSTDFDVNFITYQHTNDEANITQPHGVGFVWASMLWDLTWALVDEYGMDYDVYYGAGGNNMAMHLVINGLKLQGCDPGFIDGRDAILLADELLYNGVNKCLIWGVFANRGLGYSADQGSPYSRTDQTEAFDLPPGIGAQNTTETISSCGTYIWPANNQSYTSSGVYTETINYPSGCVGNLTLDLTIQDIDPVVTLDFNEVTIVSLPGYSAYQWIDCDNGFGVIPGANNSSYTATSNGTYAVVINDGTCSDTSECITINKVNLFEEVKNTLKIYPNPTNGMVNIDFLESFDQSTIRVYDMTGKLVQEFKLKNKEQFQFLLNGGSGVYTVEIQTDSGVVQRQKLTKLN